jgi:thiol:disulfide interchange protein DsbD
MSRLLFTCLLALVALFAAPARADDDFLPPDAAFRFSARMADAHTVVVNYAIADGYYMYRERFQFAAEGARLGDPVIPPGKVKFDETFQKNVETYHGGVEIRMPVEGSGPFTLKATGQGCADKGLCYPPQEATARLVAGDSDAGQPQSSAAPGLPFPRQDAAGAPASTRPVTTVNATAAVSGPADNTSDLSGIAALLKGGRLIAIVPAFILLGLGLAFTPCVLPMVPILSSIIVGEGGQAKRSRGFVLSVAYSLGMAIVYTALGV